MEVLVLFVGALIDRLYRNPVHHFLFYLLFLTWKKTHHFDKCSYYDFNKHQQLYGCSKINSLFRATP